MGDGGGIGLRSGRWAVTVMLLAVAACTAPGPGLDLVDEEYLAGITAEPLPLTELIPLAGLESTIGYPEGWYGESVGPFTTMAWERPEVSRWFNGDGLQGPLVFFEVETLQFMEGMGLEESSPTVSDILDFSVGTFGWTELRDEQHLTLFGGEGIQVRGRDPRGEFLGIVGILDEQRTILIMAIAPTTEDLEDLLPTWRGMVRSIRPGEPGQDV